MQRAQLTSAAIFWAESVGASPPPGSSVRQAWLAASYVGLCTFKSLPGPPIREIEIAPPLVVGSGKSLTPWLRMHREYAKNWAIVPREDAAV